MRIAKNKQDLRYQNTERKIRRSFLSFLAQGKLHIRINAVCRRAHISYSAFYDHYANANCILDGIEDSLKQEFLTSIAPQTPLRHILQKLLTFISRNKGYFIMAHQRSNIRWLLLIFQSLRPQLTEQWGIRQSNILDYWYRLLCCELISILLTWGEQEKFSLKAAPVVQKRLEKLISTAEARFRQLDNMK